MRKLMLGVMFVVLPAVALAADNPPNGGKKEQDARFDQMFRAVDADNSGKISREEAKQKSPDLYEGFDHIDANKDGGLTKAEIKKALAAADKRRREFLQSLEKADKDKNGMLSREEAKALPNMSANFDAIDSNHDEQLVLKEIADFMRANAAAAAAPAAGKPAP
ncbi:MAG: EF-hand domain-containing protein [Gallionella sp.]|nr:EF-hand domain-containing protein [Gallionella sp.]MDD4947313.1 EF-hand domain-containing protein [Gallionella sp.]MDD5612901.1 EF-hand domain-containing protein [Gallionella sp.]